MKSLFFSIMFIIGLSTASFASNSLKPVDMSAMSQPKGHKIPAYLIGAYEDAASAVSKLQKAGYTVVNQYNVAGGGISILFTDATLQEQAAKKNRGFMGVLRLYVDKKDNRISITNPIYFGKAFMQDDYNQQTFYTELQKLSNAFGTFNGSVDALDFGDLSDYHFMFAMPYYEDSITIASGSTDALLAKVKAYEGGKAFLFALKLGNDSYLVGCKLGENTSKFPQKIGIQNGLVLPYLVMISGGEAKILAPKYYLAISYPLLSMGQFMHIADVPDAIKADLKKAFQ